LSPRTAVASAGISNLSIAIPTEVWDISGSISELAYLTHNFFRYYGKFPSTLAKNLIKEFAIPRYLILDNYAGSGTTLVEAKLAGHNSFGIDVNPLGVLASKVKCRSYSIEILARRWAELRTLLEEHFSFLLSTNDLLTEHSGLNYQESRSQAKDCLSDSPKLDKWFTEKTLHDLAIVKSCILKLPPDDYREFFTLAFLAIIRRTSNAFDGEIRPHINQDKKPRPVWKAFVKKVQEMIQREREWLTVTKPEVWGKAEIGDNRSLSSITTPENQPVGMIVSHPPYLNSFDYLPIFSLELEWSRDFLEVWGDYNTEKIRAMETRAWPATQDKIFNKYFEDQRQVLGEARKVLVKGGRCCVVIGDATIHKDLVPVIKMTAEIGQDAGFDLEKIVYRTTHYGVGKYAYHHRADYHNNENGKKDGVLIFRQPS